MDDPVPAAAELEEKNALALAIVSVGNLLSFASILFNRLNKSFLICTCEPLKIINNIS